MSFEKAFKTISAILVVVSAGGCLSQDFESQSLAKYKLKNANTFTGFVLPGSKRPAAARRAQQIVRRGSFPRGSFPRGSFSFPRNGSMPTGGFSTPRGGFSAPKGQFSWPTGAGGFSQPKGGFSWPNQNSGGFSSPQNSGNGFSQPASGFSWPKGN